MVFKLNETFDDSVETCFSYFSSINSRLTYDLAPVKEWPFNTDITGRCWLENGGGGEVFFRLWKGVHFDQTSIFKLFLTTSNICYFICKHAGLGYIVSEGGGTHLSWSWQGRLKGFPCDRPNVLTLPPVLNDCSLMWTTHTCGHKHHSQYLWKAVWQKYQVRILLDISNKISCISPPFYLIQRDKYMFKQTVLNHTIRPDILCFYNDRIFEADIAKMPDILYLFLWHLKIKLYIYSSFLSPLTWTTVIGGTMSMWTLKISGLIYQT